jgi:AraC family transcriptional regulator, regulatory protein of adaptative response / DNA-3-methyladenine glycosylase II
MEKYTTEVFRQARISRDPRFDGKVFIAVKTTKIFCRTICPAKLPLEKNVTYYLSKEEALSAGYRPCFRCKPEFSPNFNELSRYSIFAQQAIKLIQSGEMLTSSVEDIASALFTSSRNLNKAFTKNLGIPLKQFQDMTKALFAKKLLYSSNLSIVEISEACGYSCVSGLYNLINRFLKVPVRKLLSKTKDGAKLTIDLKIPYINFYNWDFFLTFQSKRLISNIESIEGRVYRRTIEIENIKGYFEIKCEDRVFIITLSRSFLPKMAEVLRKISAMFDLNSNINFIEDRLKNLYPSIIKNKGLHIPGVFSPYEAGIRAICGQQVSVSAATNLLNQFVSIFHKKDEQANHYFPCPKEITVSGLDRMKTTQSKKNTLFAFSQWCCNYDINSHIDSLSQVKGIGPWTINYIKLRGMNASDIWMETDLGIKKALDKYELRNSDSAAPWRSYLSIHLWSNL